MAQAQPCVYVITSFLVIFYQSTRDVFLLFRACFVLGLLQFVHWRRLIWKIGTNYDY